MGFSYPLMEQSIILWTVIEISDPAGPAVRKKNDKATSESMIAAHNFTPLFSHTDNKWASSDLHVLESEHHGTDELETKEGNDRRPEKERKERVISSKPQTCFHSLNNLKK